MEQQTIEERKIREQQQPQSPSKRKQRQKIESLKSQKYYTYIHKNVYQSSSDEDSSEESDERSSSQSEEQDFNRIGKMAKKQGKTEQQSEVSQTDKPTSGKTSKLKDKQTKLVEKKQKLKQKKISKAVVHTLSNNVISNSKMVKKKSSPQIFFEFELVVKGEQTRSVIISKQQIFKINPGWVCKFYENYIKTKMNESQ